MQVFDEFTHQAGPPTLNTNKTAFFEGPEDRTQQFLSILGFRSLLTA